MARRQLPSIDLLRQLLRYDPDTGKLFWRERDNPVVNARLAGKEALSTKDKDGYLVGLLGGKRMLAHRVVWATVYGSWPTSEIDHINGVKDDNRVENLREATRSQNMQNTERWSTNRSGYKGVCWNKASQKWQAQISNNGIIYLGLYDTPEAAYAACCEASRRLHGEFAKTG